MIFGIGTDLVFIPRIQHMLDRYGDIAAQKILNDHEFKAFRLTIKPAAFLAKRFAAKEAFAKALGTGFRNGLNLRHIGVHNNSLGKPELAFSAKAQDLFTEKQIDQALLSLSDDGDYASAYVILTEKR